MKKDRDSNSGLREDEAKALESFFDGEADTSVAARIKSRLQNGDEALASEFESLKLVRQGLRQWHQTINTGDSIDTWSAIAGTIEQMAEKKRRGPGWGALLQGINEQLRIILHPPVLAGAATFAVVLLAVTTSIAPVSNSKAGNSAVKQITEKENAPVQTARVNSPLMFPEAARAVFRDRISQSSIVPVSLGGPSASGQLGRQMAMRLPISSLMDDNFVQGGLRTNGADINWIHSSNPFRMLPVKDHDAPPVIWVANRQH